MDSQIPPKEPKAQNPWVLNGRLIVGLLAGIGILLAIVIYLFTAKPVNSPEVINDNQVKNQQQAAVGQNPTADWKTYNNTEFEYEVKYPSDWSINEDNQPNFSTVALGGNRLHIGASSKPVKESDVCDVSYPKKSIVNIGSQQNNWCLDGNPEDRWVTFINNGNVGVVLYCWFPETQDNARVCNEALSTFKFTAKNETAEWKTYKNEEYGFEFQTGEPVNSSGLTPVQKAGGLLLNLWVGDRQINVYNYNLFYSDSVNKSEVDQLNSLIKDYNGFKENRSLVDQGNQEPESGPFYLNVFKNKIDVTPVLDIRSDSTGGSQRVVIMRKDNLIFRFYSPESYFRYNSETRKMELIDANVVDPVFEKILSTFKFIN